MNLTKDAFLSQLDEKATNYDRTKTIDDKRKTEIWDVLDELKLCLQMLQLDEAWYMSLLQSIIEKRHAKWVSTSSVYYYFYQQIWRNISENKERIVTTDSKQEKRKWTFVKAVKKEKAVVLNEILGEFPIEEEWENINVELSVSETDIQDYNPEETVTSIIEQTEISWWLIEFISNRNQNKEEIEKTYNKSDYAEIFKTIGVLHDEYINEFDLTEQSTIKELYKHYTTCKDDKTFWIRAYLQNKRVNLYREVRDILKSIALTV